MELRRIVSRTMIMALIALTCGQAISFASTSERWSGATTACEAALNGVNLPVEPAPRALGLATKVIRSIRADISYDRYRIFADKYYFLIEMHPGYEGETRDSVVYFDRVARAERKLFVHNGDLYAGYSEPMKLEGDYIFVMDLNGNIYVEHPQIGVIHHSSLSSGRAVAAAGHLSVRDGKLLVMTNLSGHYTPPAWMARQAYERLIQLGVDLPDNRFEEWDGK